MKNKEITWARELKEPVLRYLNSLKKEEYKYFPAEEGLTKYGKNLNLGFSCFSLKINYILNQTKNFNNDHIEGWKKYINSYQKEKDINFNNYFVDPYIDEFYNQKSLENYLKELSKKILNIMPNYNFEYQKIKLAKAVNAETKQAISTLYQLGMKNEKLISNDYSNNEALENYLNSLDWAKPWNAGAQFASFCVYSKTQNFENASFLVDYITKLANSETGSYFTSTPKTNREIINGAMKVISGLDWLGEEIHHPKKLIDFCLLNTPVLEGCDIVDFVYVLYMCSNQTEYKKKEINNLMLNYLSKIKDLYFESKGGFSYFKDSSQTHYYGVPIIDGRNQPDIHGTMLLIWAISMILKNNEIDLNWKIIKP